MSVGITGRLDGILPGKCSDTITSNYLTSTQSRLDYKAAERMKHHRINDNCSILVE